MANVLCSGSLGITYLLSSYADNATLVIHSVVISCLLGLMVLWYHTVEKAVLVTLEGYTVFHHGFFHALTLLVGLTVVHLVGIQLGSQTHELGDGFTNGFGFHCPSGRCWCRTIWGRPRRCPCKSPPSGFGNRGSPCP